MPEIPVPTRDCESDQDKLLYNIWQQVRAVPMPQIPGIVSGLTPYGWDVNSTTNQLLYNIWLNMGGGGGGGGTVTSVATDSLSLRNASIPNPIVGAGTVSFEVQVIDILRADLITAIAGNDLLEGVVYNVTDPQTPLNELWVYAMSGNQLAATMWGTAGASSRFVVVSWDHVTDQICEIYCPVRNNRTSRFNDPATPWNCIESFDTTSGNYRNCWLVNCDFVSDGTCFGDELIGETVCSILSLNGAFPFGVRVGNFAGYQMDGTAPAHVVIGPFAQVTMDTFDYECIRVGAGAIVDYFGASILRENGGATIETNSYSLQPVSAEEAGTATIINTYKTYMYIKIQLAGNLTDFTLETPDRAYDGQIVEITFVPNDFTSFFTVTNFAISSGDFIDYVTTTQTTRGNIKLQWVAADATWVRIR